MHGGTDKQQRDNVADPSGVALENLAQDSQIPGQPQAETEGTGKYEPLQKKLMFFGSVNHECRVSERVELYFGPSGSGPEHLQSDIKSFKVMKAFGLPTFV